ncbi:SH3 domain-containing protein [Thioclava electrotropha]|uniref:SH3 domain-containing protein n=1 Tax=Thioclava electrotropha TaxID=1549850 RepID=A0ABX6YT53_9RHOB|nr:SH3 domain-containing protein [Thioclava electrotropha]QPZ91011.1 SH3 domain-containing protein [Thioclava electrotropha]
MFQAAPFLDALRAASTAALCAFSLALGAPQAAAQESVPISFPRGQSGVAINGAVTGRDYIDYVLRGNAGQRMDVDLTVTGTNGNGIAYFNILPAGMDYNGLFVGSNEGNSASVILPETRDWAIRVYLMGNDRDTGKTVGFTINVSITGKGSGGSTSGGSQSGGMLPEEGFFIVTLRTPGDTLNIRNAPRPSGRLLGKLPNGTVVRNVGGCTMSDGRQWCKVQDSRGGVQGWVAARFLRLPGPGGGENTATADDGGGAMAGSGSADIRVQFAPGSSGAELSGQLLPQRSQRYILGAANGQNLYFRLAANGPGMTYVIYNPDGSVLLDEMPAAQEYRGQLFQSGDHMIDVYNTANGAQSYTVIFGID